MTDRTSELPMDNPAPTYGPEGWSQAATLAEE